ncbi:hypothetical protein GGI03_002132 [Coemansia sp. RSA 2337]|nr:hypothetical protein GGH92_000555 [Coemansia sp. RSA 2673]KAJ2466405.1 hypothetical protein GGI03_002132 [Coemansia sp. RSA 2337]
MALPRKSTLFDTPEERITELEKMFGMSIDPVGSMDTMVIALGSAIFAITGAFIVAAWINNSYRPIRAKNLPLTTILYVSGILWFVGDLPMNGHVLLTGAFSQCKFWNIWVRVLFCFIYTSVLSIRCYALDRVFNQNKPTRGLAYYLPSIFFIGGYIVYSIITTALPGRMTIGYAETLELCSTTEVYVIVTLCLLWFNWAIIIVMMIRLRNIQSTFNEFYEFLFICFFGMAAMVKTTTVHFTHPKYPLVLGYRIAETLGDVLIINGIILVIMAYPVVMSLVRNKEYEREWLLRLRTDGLQDMYEANLNLRAEGPVHYARMNGSVSNQLEKNTVDEGGRESRYFDTQRFGHNHHEQDGVDREVCEGYRASEEVTAIPNCRGNADIRCYDTQSVDSLDTVDGGPKGRRIL